MNQDKKVHQRIAFLKFVQINVFLLDNVRLLSM